MRFVFCGIPNATSDLAQAIRCPTGKKRAPKANTKRLVLAAALAFDLLFRGP
jgi:hypothetical protein